MIDYHYTMVETYPIHIDDNGGLIERSQDLVKNEVI